MNPANVSIDKAALIRRIPIFADLPDSAQKLIEENSYVAEYRKDHLLYREGAPPDSFYCMLTGRARVFIKTPSGEEKTLIFLHRGDYVGIISLLTDEPHSASVDIINDSLILRIDKKDFRLLLKEIPQLALKFGESLSRRLKKKESEPKSVFESAIISVFGLARKAGRTMYAVNLAIALATETRKKVILLDMSHSGNECASMLKMDELKCVDLERHIVNYEDAKSLIVKYEAGDIYLLNMGCAEHTRIDPANVISFLSSLASEFNYIVVDMPAEMDKSEYTILAQCDLVHVVTDCNEHNLKATGKFMSELKKALRDPENTVKAVINEFVQTDTFEEEVGLLGHKAYATLPDLGFLAGMISAGFLEASNVDIATQFSDIIVAQQAYSANAKIMTTADQMIQSLLTVIQ